MGTRTDNADDNNDGREGPAEIRVREVLASITAFDRMDTRMREKFGVPSAGRLNCAEGNWHLCRGAESQPEITNKLEVGESEGKDTKKEIDDKEDKEAEGSTPSEKMTYASKVAGRAGEKSRRWVDEIRETEDREEVGQQMEGARRMEEKDGARRAGVKESAQEQEKSEGTGEVNKGERSAEIAERERNRDWQQEIKRRRAKARNVVFAVSGEVTKEDRVEKERAQKWIEALLKRKAEVEDMWYVKDDLLVVRLERIEDAREILQRRDEIWEQYDMWVDKDRTFKERKHRWLVSERARKEREEGKKVTEIEGKLCVDGTWWVWREKEEEWYEEKQNRETVKTASRREELARWRQDLEERMRELEKEERELEEAERELRETEEAKASNEKGGVEVDTGVREELEENCVIQTNGGKAVNGQGSAESLYSIRSNQGKAETKKKGKIRKSTDKTPEERNWHCIETDPKEKRRIEVKKWRADLEHRKAELKKELEELEAEEAKEPHTDKTESVKGGVTSSQAGE